MDLKFQLLDCDYFLLDNKPVVRLFGKDENQQSVCAFVHNFQPYFYVHLKGEKKELVDFIESKFKNMIVSIEYVEKFLPIGYQKDKTEVVKIVLKDPSTTPIVRDEILRQNFVKNVYEADILFKYRFMADKNIFGMRWIKVTGNGINTQTVNVNKTITAENVETIEETKNANLKFLSVDIEIVPGKEGIPNPKEDQISMISLSFYPAFESSNTLVLMAKSIRNGVKDTRVFNNEKEMLQEFLEILERYDPDIILGYNINNFDLPFILERLSKNRLPRTLGRCNSKQSISMKFGSKTRTNVTGRIIADVYEIVKEYAGKGLIRLKRYGLGDVSKELINEDKVDIAHGEIKKYWNGNEDDINKLIAYSRKDAELALKLLLDRDMISKFVEISKVSGLLLQDVMEGGEAARVDNLLLREFNKKDFIIPNKPNETLIKQRENERNEKGFKGALVLEPKVGLFTNNIVYLDFKSMYPSIFIMNNICTATFLNDGQDVEHITTPNNVKFVSPKIRESIFSKIVKDLITERDKVKEKMYLAKSEKERKIFDARQWAFKYMTNAFYGYVGYSRARLYVLDIASAITACGREFIMQTKKIVEEDPEFKVVYGDTDSIMVEVQTKDLDKALEFGKIIEKKINEKMEGKIEMKIEYIFKSLLIMSKKRYAGLVVEKNNGETAERIIMKGIETVRRDWCDLTSKTLYSILDILLKEQDRKKAFNFAKEIINKLEKNQVDIEDLVITKSISKSVKEYKGIQPHIELVKKLKERSPAEAPGVGDRVSFVIVKGMQLLSERAEDPAYIKANNLKIDSKYYIESQILPPLERVFESIGIDRSELIGLGRQMLLSDAIKNGIKKTNFVDSITKLDGVVCSKCNQTYRRMPLIGKCHSCNGELLFFGNDSRSRAFSI